MFSGIRCFLLSCALRARNICHEYDTGASVGTQHMKLRVAMRAVQLTQRLQQAKWYAPRIIPNKRCDLGLTGTRATAFELPCDGLLLLMIVGR